MTFTTMDPVQPGTWLQVDGEPLLRVIAYTGSRPFTLTVRPVTRWDRWLVRMWARKRRLRARRRLAACPTMAGAGERPRPTGSARLRTAVSTCDAA